MTNEEMIKAVEEYKNLKAMAKELEAMMKEQEEAIKAEMESRKVEHFEDGGVTVHWTEYITERFDKNLMIKKYGQEAYNECKKDSVSRRFAVA